MQQATFLIFYRIKCRFMENNKAYLKKLPQVFLVILLVCCIREFVFHYHSLVRMDQPSSTGFMVNEILLGATFFLGLGYLLNKWKLALITFAVLIIILALDSLFLAGDQLGLYPKPMRITLFIGISILYYFPYFLFFLLQKASAKKMLVIAGVLLLTRGFVPFYSFSAVYETVDKMFGKNVMSHDFLNMLFYAALGTVRLILYCELQNYINEKASVNNMLLLNPGNDYSKASGTIVFWSIKTFILVICTGLGYYIYSMRYYAGLNLTGAVLIFYSQYIIQMFFTLFVMMFFTWYLRKFLLEYCITYNITSRFFYWLLLLPFIGFFVWLFLLPIKKTWKQEQKAASIEQWSTAGSSSVTMAYLVMLLVQLVFFFTNTEQQYGLFYTLCTLSLFTWMIFSRTGYKVNLWLRMAAYSSVLLWFFFKVEKHEAFTISFVYPVLLYGIIQLMLLYPVYHFDSFVYLSKTENENDGTTTNDLLSEFDPG